MVPCTRGPECRSSRSDQPQARQDKEISERPRKGRPLRRGNERELRRRARWSCPPDVFAVACSVRNVPLSSGHQPPLLGQLANRRSTSSRIALCAQANRTVLVELPPRQGSDPQRVRAPSAATARVIETLWSWQPPQER